MTNADEQRVTAIRERAEAATKGPWARSKHYKLNIVSDATGQIVTGHATPNSTNAEFIAAAREDIPWLLDRLRAVEAERDALRDKLTRPLTSDSHDADWWRRTSSFWAGQDEMHERALRAAEAELADAEDGHVRAEDAERRLAVANDRIARAEKALLGGLGGYWRVVVDEAILILRGAK